MSELTNSATILNTTNRGGSRISGKGVYMYKGVCRRGGGGGGCFVDFISFFLNIP